MTTPTRLSPREALAWLWRTLRRQAEWYALYLLESDQTSGGTVRMVGYGLTLILWWFMHRLAAPDLPLLGLVGGVLEQAFGALAPLAAFFLSFIDPLVLRHLIPPVSAALLAWYVGAKYLQDLLETPKLGLAWRFVQNNLFGGGYPQMTIQDGKVTLHEADINPLLKLGGPGWVNIVPGSAALFERGLGPSNVLGSGTHFIRRFEMLREAFDLREVERRRDDIAVYTLDGVPLTLSEVQARFRLRFRGPRTEENPYPVLARAVRAAVYTPERKVGKKGLDDWADAVMSAITGRIVSWIARQPMHNIIPPPRPALTASVFETEFDTDRQAAFRRTLQALLTGPEMRDTLAQLGAELNYVNIGHVRPNKDLNLEAAPTPADPDGIHRQMIATWKAEQEARVTQELSEAHSHARAFYDTIYARSQLDLVNALAESLNEAHRAGLTFSQPALARLTEYIANLRPDMLNAPADKDEG